jgi:hypothetical protein
MSAHVYPFFPRQCPQCGVKFYGLFDSLSHTCPTRDPYAYRYSDEDTEEEEEVTTPALPAITASGFEEITPERASRIYELLVRATSAHAARCVYCDMLATDNRVCYEQNMLFAARERWLLISLGKDK